MNIKDQKYESMTAADREVAELLVGLPRAEAPANFTLRVRAGIAERNSAFKSASFLPLWLKFATPLAMLMLIGLFYFGAYDGAPVPQTVAVAEPPTIAASASNDAVTNEVSNSTAASAQRLETTAAAVKRESVAVRGATRQAERRSINIEPAGGSIDRALRSSSNAVLPNGLNAVPVNTNVRPRGFDGGAKIAVREMLSLLGIEAEYEAAGWAVKSARPNSAAERSGLKAGDVVESLDGRRLEKDTVFVDSVNGRTMSVRRDGRVIVLGINNR